MFSRKNIMLCILILTLISFNSRTLEVANAHEYQTLSLLLEDIIKELKEINLKYYAKQIEQTIIRDKFLEEFIYSEDLDGMLEISFYYCNEKEAVIFYAENVEKVFELYKIEAYERYSIESKNINEFDKQKMEYIGTCAVDCSGNKEYKLPELTNVDYTEIDLVVAEINSRIAARQEIYNYNLYLGDFIRGFKEDKEYISLVIVLIGKQKYYIWIEVIKNSQENGKDDIWMFPSPFLPLNAPEALYQNQEMYLNVIDRIVSLNNKVATIKNE